MPSVTVAPTTPTIGPTWINIGGCVTASDGSVAENDSGNGWLFIPFGNPGLHPDWIVAGFVVRAKAGTLLALPSTAWVVGWKQPLAGMATTALVTDTAQDDIATYVEDVGAGG